MPTLVSLSEVKTYLGLTGTADDGLIASVASNASIMAERDTGRIFAVTSNVTRRYSTEGQAAITIHDRPYNDTTRVVTLEGVTMTQDTNYWLLTDRRNTDVSTTIQLRYFGSGADSYKSDPGWFDRNLDRQYWRIQGSPNNLVITGTEGHPVLPLDVKQAVIELAAYLYWQAKSGASGIVSTPTGATIALGDKPQTYQDFVKAWRIRTAVVEVT